MDKSSSATLISASAPIGIFDSGVGGLSVLRHIRSLLPQEELLYFADAGFAPYGEKSETAIVERALAIAAFLMQFHVKAMVVACNTATAAAIAALRERYPQLQVVGVEPGLKPATALTRSGVIGVLATATTLASDKFQKLQQHLAAAHGVTFLTQACNGLADQIEKGELQSRDTAALVERYVAPLLAQRADTLVLGCTHYPFVAPLIASTAASAAEPVQLIDTGEAVARQLVRLLTQHGLLQKHTERHAGLRAFTSGSQSALTTAFRVLLELSPPVEQVSARVG